MSRDDFNPDISFATMLDGEYYQDYLANEHIVQNSLIFPQAVKENNIDMIIKTYGYYQGDKLKVAIKQKNFEAFQTFIIAGEQATEEHFHYSVYCHNIEVFNYFWKRCGIKSYNNAGELLLETVKQIIEVYCDVKNQIDAINLQFKEEKLEFQRLHTTWARRHSKVIPTFINVHGKIHQINHLSNMYGWWSNAGYDIQYFMYHICPKPLAVSTALMIEHLLCRETNTVLLFSKTNAFFFKIVELLPNLHPKFARLCKEISKFKENAQIPQSNLQPTSTLNVISHSLYEQKTR